VSVADYAPIIARSLMADIAAQLFDHAKGRLLHSSSC
jgi:hypothetical protein